MSLKPVKGKIESQELNDNFSYLDSTIRNIDKGSPKGVFDTIQELKDAYPDGNNDIYVVGDSWYYWGGHDWGKGGVYQAHGIANESVSPDKTTFFKTTRNIAGERVSGRLAYNSGIGVLQYAIEVSGLSGSLEIIKIAPNQTYTAKVHDPKSGQLFYMGIIDKYPNFSVSYQPVDSLNYRGLGNTEHTFTNTSTGKYLVVYVSDKDNDFPKLQVEVGEVATEYVPTHLLNEIYIEDKEVGDATIINHSAKKPHEAIIVGCQEDETTSIIRADLSYDKENYIFGNKGYKITFPGITISGEDAELEIDYSDEPLKIDGMGVIGLYIYIDEPELFRYMNIRLYSDAEKTNEWNARVVDSGTYALEGIKKGWNHLRWRASHGTNYDHNLTDWGTISHVKISLAVHDKTTVTIGKLVGEINDKARILFVEDAQYKTFYDNGYPDLKERNMPVTWALRIKNIGSNVGNERGEQMSYEQVTEVAKENDNVMSFHSWGFTKPTADMSAEELRKDVVKSIKWLSAHGFDGWHWRAAFFQNKAPSHRSVRDLLTAYSYPGATDNPLMSQTGLDAFPFLNRYSTQRYALHNRTKEDLTNLFEMLKKTRQVLIIYTHGVYDDNPSDTTLDLWNHFISKIDIGINEGWLEGATFNQLNEEYGNYYGIDTKD